MADVIIDLNSLKNKNSAWWTGGTVSLPYLCPRKDAIAGYFTKGAISISGSYTDSQLVCEKDVSAVTRVVTATVTEYQNVSVGASTASDIPASGSTGSGVRASATVTYQQRTRTDYNYGSSSYTSWENKSATIYGGYVTASSKGTTISNRTSTGKTSTPSGTVAGAARTGTAVTIYLAANLVTKIEANSNSFSYSAIGAGATSASATSSHAPKYTFSSGSSSTTTPGSTYGTLSTSVSYSMANNTTGGFTACNSSTGALTATSRGISYSTDVRSSATVTKTLKYTWTHTSTYGSSSVNTGNLTKTATCPLNKNVITSVAISSNAGAIAAPALFGAGGDTTGKATTNTTSGSLKSLVLTYSSGSTRDVTNNSASDTLNRYSTYGTLTGPSYTWSGGGNGISITGGTSATTTVKADSRSTSLGAARSTTITRSTKYSFVLNSSYNNGLNTTTTSAAADCTCSPSLAANTLSWSFTTLPTWNSSNDIPASGGSVTLSNNPVVKGTYSSGATAISSTYSSTTYGTWSVTGASATSLGSTVKARTKIATKKVVFTASSTYGGGSVTSTTSDTYQAANAFSKAVIKTGSAGAITVPNFGAAGGTNSATTNNTSATAAANAVITVTYTSNGTKDYTPSALTYIWSEKSDSLGVITVSSSSNTTTTISCTNPTTTVRKAGTYEATRTARYTYTENGTSRTIDTSCSSSGSITANNLKSVVIKTASAGSITAPSAIAASGGSGAIANGTSPTAAASAVLTATYDSNSSKDVNASSSSYSWGNSLSGYSGLNTSNTGTSLNASSSSNSATIYIYFSNRTTTCGAARSTRVTRYITYSYTDNGVTKSASTSCYCDPLLSRNAITGATIAVNAGAIGNLTFAAAGETKNFSSTTGPSCTSVTVKFTSGSSSTSYSSYGTLSGPAYTYSASGTGFATNSSNLVVASNNTTTSSRSGTGTRKATYTFTVSTSLERDINNASGNNSCTCTLTQSAGAKDSYTAWAPYISSNVSTIAATGGTATITAYSYRTYKWNGTGNALYEYLSATLSRKRTNRSGTLGATTVGSTSGPGTTTLIFDNNKSTANSVGTVVATSYSTGTTAEVSVTLQAGVKNYTSGWYAVWFSTNSYADLPASGLKSSNARLIEVEFHKNYYWNNVTTDTGYDFSYPSSVTSNQTWASVWHDDDEDDDNLFHLNVDSRGTVVGTARTVTITAICKSDTSIKSTKNYTLEANSASTGYGDIEAFLNYNQVSSLGGSVSPSEASASRPILKNYTSGISLRTGLDTSGFSLSYLLKPVNNYVSAGTNFSTTGNIVVTSNSGVRSREIGTVTLSASKGGKSKAASCTISLAGSEATPIIPPSNSCTLTIKFSRQPTTEIYYILAVYSTSITNTSGFAIAVTSSGTETVTYNPIEGITLVNLSTRTTQKVKSGTGYVLICSDNLSSGSFINKGSFTIGSNATVNINI